MSQQSGMEEEPESSLVIQGEQSSKEKSDSPTQPQQQPKLTRRSSSTIPLRAKYAICKTADMT